MRHTRWTVAPSWGPVARSAGHVATLVTLLTLFGLALRSASPSLDILIVPLAVVLVFAGCESVWLRMRAPLRLVLDERGIEIFRRDAGSELLEWTDLAEWSRGLWLAGWRLRRKDGRVLRVPAIGLPPEAMRTVDARLADVLDGAGPPLLRGTDAAGPPQREEIPETAGSLAAGLAGACGGAVLGAIAWAMLIVIADFEIGFLAVGVGALVGGGAKMLGAAGRATAPACAVLALVSILLGKGIAVRYLVEREMAKSESGFDRAAFDSIERAAAEWGDGLPQGEHARFAAAHGFASTPNKAEVTEEDLRGFREHSIPFLEWWRRSRPEFEAWREDSLARFREQAYAEFSFVRAIGSTLGPIDVVFLFLGAATAFRMGRGREPPPTARRPGRVRAAGADGGKAVGGVVFPPKRKQKDPGNPPASPSPEAPPAEGGAPPSAP